MLEPSHKLDTREFFFFTVQIINESVQPCGLIDLKQRVILDVVGDHKDKF